MYAYYKVNGNSIEFSLSIERPNEFVQYWVGNEKADAQAVYTTLKAYSRALSAKYPQQVEFKEEENAGFYLSTSFVRSALSYLQQRSFVWFKTRDLPRVFQAQEGDFLNKKAVSDNYPSYNFLNVKRGNGKPRENAPAPAPVDVEKDEIKKQIAQLDGVILSFPALAEGANQERERLQKQLDGIDARRKQEEELKKQIAQLDGVILSFPALAEGANQERERLQKQLDALTPKTQAPAPAQD